PRCLRVNRIGYSYAIPRNIIFSLSCALGQAGPLTARGCGMIRTGQQYRDSLKDGRQVWMNGERIMDVAIHPAFKPIVDIRARIYDTAHEKATASAMTCVAANTAETNAVRYERPP